MTEHLSVPLDINPYAKMLPEGARNWGFTIEELGGSHEMYPMDEIFTGREDMPSLIEENLHKGRVHIVDEMSGEEIPDKAVPLGVSTQITRDEYDQKVKEGVLKPAISRFGNPLRFIDTDTAKEYGVVHAFPEKEKEVMHESMYRSLIHRFDQDYQFPGIEEVEGVKQVFEMRSGEHMVHLYNFSPTQLTGEDLQQTINAVREVNERSGGSLMNGKLKVMAILPKSHSFWQKPSNQEAADKGATGVLATATHFGEVLINEAMLNQGKEQLGDDGPRFSMSNGRLEVTIVHELTHVIERDDAQRNAHEQYGTKVGWDLKLDARGYPKEKPEFVGESMFPHTYGQVSAPEDAAETGAAEFTDELEGVSDVRRQALAEVYARQHSGDYGPTYLRVNEVDISQLTQKIGSNLKADVTFVPKFTYELIDSSQAA